MNTNTDLGSNFPIYDANLGKSEKNQQNHPAADTGHVTESTAKVGQKLLTGTETGSASNTRNSTIKLQPSQEKQSFSEEDVQNRASECHDSKKSVNKTDIPATKMSLDELKGKSIELKNKIEKQEQIILKLEELVKFKPPKSLETELKAIENRKGLLENDKLELKTINSQINEVEEADEEDFSEFIAEIESKEKQMDQGIKEPVDNEPDFLATLDEIGEKQETLGKQVSSFISDLKTFKDKSLTTSTGNENELDRLGKKLIKDSEELKEWMTPNVDTNVSSEPSPQAVAASTSQSEKTEPYGPLTENRASKPNSQTKEERAYSNQIRRPTVSPQSVKAQPSHIEGAREQEIAKLNSNQNARPNSIPQTKEMRAYSNQIRRPTVSPQSVKAQSSHIEGAREQEIAKLNSNQNDRPSVESERDTNISEKRTIKPLPKPAGKIATNIPEQPADTVQEDQTNLALANDVKKKTFLGKIGAFPGQVSNYVNAAIEKRNELKAAKAEKEAKTESSTIESKTLSQRISKKDEQMRTSIQKRGEINRATKELAELQNKYDNVTQGFTNNILQAERLNVGQEALGVMTQIYFTAKRSALQEILAKELEIEDLKGKKSAPDEYSAAYENIKFKKNPDNIDELDKATAYLAVRSAEKPDDKYLVELLSYYKQIKENMRPEV